MFINPMLLATAPSPFSHSDYIFEPKVDGHRLIFSQQSGVIRLYTRHNNDCTMQYPELHVPFEDDIILDGEIACVDPETGISDFEAVMSRFQAKKADKINGLTRTLPITYVIFDILMYRGRDLRRLSLMERKAILSNIILPGKAFGVTPFVEEAGEALFEQIEAWGMEGIVGKRKNSQYISRRSDAWRKVINWSFAGGIHHGVPQRGFRMAHRRNERVRQAAPGGDNRAWAGSKRKKSLL
ncbi:ATP-dependent DNA ligase [Paenibacillus mangrovi]|uniref:ATP-dependent DNA ligase n=1 Tax=Paenibacillus mangrovi TaxID=2931978 RepID=UPI0031408E35